MALLLWATCTSDPEPNIDQRNLATCTTTLGYLYRFDLCRNLRIYSTADFIRKCGSTPWVAIPGFAVERIWDDWLHIVDLAIAPDACAPDGSSVPLLVIFIVSTGFGLVRLFPRHY